jgi:spore maturation protein CgeB
MDSLDPYPYFSNNGHGDWRDFLNGGLSKWDKKRNFGFMHEIDTLYRYKDQNYMRYINDFLDKFSDFDIFVMSSFNPIHPEVIDKYLKNKVKILGFVDDPYSTYTRGIPHLWAFDGAFYISPSYSKEEFFENSLNKWGSENNIWLPLCPKTIEFPTIDENFFKNRPVDLVYVGNYIGYPNGSKVDRLIKLKKHFGDRFQIHGRWPLKGYIATVRGLLGKPFFYNRITGISQEDRENLYFNTKIGLNMHVSPTPTETGNMRMYETPYHGMMQICDKAGANAHELIYKPNKEAVFYDSTDEAIDLIEHYLTHDEERIKIAKAGFERTLRDYNWENNWKKLLDWAWSLKNESR